MYFVNSAVEFNSNFSRVNCLFIPALYVTVKISVIYRDNRPLMNYDVYINCKRGAYQAVVRKKFLPPASGIELVQEILIANHRG